MSHDSELVIHTDGAARGNPGPAAYAYTISGADTESIEEAGCLGPMTSNQAEYTALIKALEHAVHLGTQHRLSIHSDSELMVKQMNGEYRVKDGALQKLHERVSNLVAQFDDVEIQHVRRSQNVDADRLCNEALDGLREPMFPHIQAAAMKAGAITASISSAATAVDARKTSRGDRDKQVRGKILDILNDVAKSWARGDANDPPPESVLDEIWELLQEPRTK